MEPQAHSGTRARAGRRIDVDIAPVETPLYWGESLALARHDCPTSHPRFAGNGPLRHAWIGFPRRASALSVNGGPAFVANASCMVIMNAGDAYARTRVAAEGCYTFVFGLSDALVEAIVDGAVPRALDRFGAPRFPYHSVPVAPEQFVRSEMLIRRARESGADDLGIEEAFGELVSDILAAHDAPPALPGRARRARIVRATLELLSADLERKWTLPALGRAVGASPFHLARMFRDATGSSVHRYVTQLRVRRALELTVAGATDLSAVAHAVGFSSHAHLTTAFTRCFGKPPSHFRS